MDVHAADHGPVTDKTIDPSPSDLGLADQLGQLGLEPRQLVVHPFVVPRVRLV